MDEILIYVALFIFYAVAQVLKARKQRQQKQNAPPPGIETEHYDTDETGRIQDDLTFKEALAEIQSALRGEPLPEPTPVETMPLDAEEERLRPRPDPVPRAVPRAEPQGEFRGSGFQTSETLKPGPAFQPLVQNDFGSASFQSLEDADIGSSIPTLAKPIELGRPARRGSKPSLATRLHSAEVAREAFVLSEIFGPPGGLHKPPKQS